MHNTTTSTNEHQTTAGPIRPPFSHLKRSTRSTSEEKQDSEKTTPRGLQSIEQRTKNDDEDVHVVGDNLTREQKQAILAKRAALAVELTRQAALAKRSELDKRAVLAKQAELAKMSEHSPVKNSKRNLPSKRSFEKSLEDSFRWHTNDESAVRPNDIIHIGAGSISYYSPFLPPANIISLRKCLGKMSKSGGCVVFWQPESYDEHDDEKHPRDYFRKEFIVKPPTSPFSLKLKVEGRWQTASPVSLQLEEANEVLDAANFAVKYVCGEGFDVLGVQGSVVKSPDVYPHPLLNDVFLNRGWKALVIPVNGDFWPHCRSVKSKSATKSGSNQRLSSRPSKSNGQRQQRKVGKDDHFLANEVQRGGVLLLDEEMVAQNDFGIEKWMVPKHYSILVLVTIFYQERAAAPLVPDVDDRFASFDDGFDEDEF